MWMLFVEVLLVLAILAGVVWWTMFSGRPKEGPAAPPDTVDERQPRP
jgi:hypothetical protein